MDRRERGERMEDRGQRGGEREAGRGKRGGRREEGIVEREILHPLVYSTNITL